MDQCFHVPLVENETTCENEFDLHENEPVGGSQLIMNFALVKIH